MSVTHYTIASPFICRMCIFLQPTLDRQVSKAVVEEPESSLPMEGEGSEYGRKWKDEVRKKRRGYNRKQDPDDNPWVLKEKKRGGKQLGPYLSIKLDPFSPDILYLVSPSYTQHSHLISECG